MRAIRRGGCSQRRYLGLPRSVLPPTSVFRIAGGEETKRPELNVFFRLHMHRQM